MGIRRVQDSLDDTAPQCYDNIISLPSSESSVLKTSASSSLAYVE